MPYTNSAGFPDQSIMGDAFYSALSLIELIGGLTLETYIKRRAILSHIISSAVTFFSYFQDELF